MRQNDLQYYMHDGDAVFRFELSGDLSAGGACGLEQAWRTASSMIGGRCLVIDLSYVVNIDATGRELLAKWHSDGACLVVISSEAKARIQSMTGRPVTLMRESQKASTWLPVRATPIWFVALIGLLFPATASAAIDVAPATSIEVPRSAVAGGSNKTLHLVMFSWARSGKVRIANVERTPIRHRSRGNAYEVQHNRNRN